MRLMAHLLRDNGGQSPAGRVACDDDAIGIEAERYGFARQPAIGRQRVVDRGGKLVFGREPVIDGDDGAAGAGAEIAAGEVVAFEAADGPAAAMEIENGRQQARHCAGWPVDPDTQGAGGTGQGAVEDRADRRRVSAQQLHEGVEILARVGDAHRVQGGLAAIGQELQKPLGAAVQGPAIHADRGPGQDVDP